MRYEVTSDIYEGPLPLLVELAKLNLVDIFIVKLVDLTQQYLEQVRASGVDLNDLSEPLPLLGNLVALKARGLMPQPGATGEDEEVPIGMEELERRLKEYEQFKTVAQLLAELHHLAHKHFPRERAVLPEDAGSQAEEPQGLGEVNLADLVGAFSKVLERAVAPIYEVSLEPWTVEMKVKDLRVLLAVKRQVRFFDLFAASQTKLEVVVTFLAVLELIRQRFVRAVQERPFADIMVVFHEQAEIASPTEPLPAARPA